MPPHRSGRAGEVHARAAGDSVSRQDDAANGATTMLACRPNARRRGADARLARCSPRPPGAVGQADCAADHRQAARDAGRGFEEARDAALLEGIGSRREAGQVVHAAAGAQQVAFVEIPGGRARRSLRRALRDGIAELDRVGGVELLEVQQRCLLADLLASRGADEEAARWCSAVRAVAQRRRSDRRHPRSTRSMACLAARRGATAEAERLTRTCGRDRLDHRYVRPQGARVRAGSARTLALVGRSRLRRAMPPRPRSRSTRRRAISRPPPGPGSSSTPFQRRDNGTTETD